MRYLACRIALLFMTLAPASTVAADPTYVGEGFPYGAFDQLPQTTLRLGGSKIVVSFAPGDFALPRDRILAWIKKSAEAVATYYDGFPVPEARVLLIPGSGASVSGGQAFGYGGPAIRLKVGSGCTEVGLDADWQAVHEMVHLALPEVPEDNLWLAEGLAVYVESIARVQAGDLTPEKIWGDFVRDMPKGLPKDGDQGLDETHTWGRTYWGGAIFYLLADIELRKATANTIGLQQAMRGVVAAGGTHDHDWSVEKILIAADTATSTHVMRDLYEKMRAAPFDPDLTQIWKDLGVQSVGGKIAFDDTAPLAAIRKTITSRPVARGEN